MAEALLNNLHILIMAGGSGTRFWPKSRIDRPKQLLALWDEKTLIEHTVERFSKIVPAENIWVITTKLLEKATKDILSKHYPQIRYLFEPTGQNTAPCILWGCLEVNKLNPNAVIAVMPADHFIGKKESFQEKLAQVARSAQNTPGIFTLGIKPDRPETGYGYIEIEKSIFQSFPADPVSVVRFVEKPDHLTATRYIQSGKFLWNAGMFLFSVRSGLDAFQSCMPTLFKTFQSSASSYKNAYPQIQKEDAISIDYGVLEKAQSKNISIFVQPVECQWNDIGSYAALEEIDCATKGNIISVDSACNIVHSDQGVIALLGVNDMVVVRDGNVVLVCAKDRVQEIRKLQEIAVSRGFFSSTAK